MGITKYNLGSDNKSNFEITRLGCWRERAELKAIESNRLKIPEGTRFHFGFPQRAGLSRPTKSARSFIRLALNPQARFVSISQVID